MINKIPNLNNWTGLDWTNSENQTWTPKLENLDLTDMDTWTDLDKIALDGN